MIIKYVLNSLVLVIGVVALTLFIGVLAAWFLVFYDLPFKKLISTLLVLPIAIPPYAVAYCYAAITDKGGSVDSVLSGINLGESYLSMLNVRSLAGCIFVLSLTTLPFHLLVGNFQGSQPLFYRWQDRCHSMYVNKYFFY